MFRKLIACLLVFFLLCTPAYASTTPSFLSMSRSVNSYGSVTIAGARYDASSDTFYATTFKSGLPGTLLDSSGLFLLPQEDLNFNSASPFLGFALKFSDMVSADKGDSWSVTLNHFMLFFRSVWNGITLYLNVNPSFSSPVQTIAICDWSGTGKYVNPSTGSVSYVSYSDTIRFPVNVSASNTQLQEQTGGSFTERFVSDINMQVTFDLPDSFVDGGYTYEVTSAYVDSMTIYVVYPFRPSNLFNYSGIPITESYPGFDTNGLSVTNYSRFLYANGEPKINVFVSASGQSTNAIQQSIGSVGQSIAQLQQNVTKQITEVKTTIQQGANEVKTEISNQTQAITDKLTDVKETTKQGFEDVVQGITDLPEKMQEMLLGFVIPDVDTVADKMSDFQRLAEEKLGIIYQVPAMIFDAFDALVNGAVNPQTTMVFPAFSLPWIDGTQLKLWDSQEFEIIPSGLEVLRDLIQTITSMVFVIMTFNSLKRTYERFFLGGEK